MGRVTGFLWWAEVLHGASAGATCGGQRRKPSSELSASLSELQTFVAGCDFLHHRIDFSATIAMYI
jgi:hypothetical protein